MINQILKKRELNFQDIVFIQSELNKKADPNNPDWINARTVEDYKLAGIVEFIELLDSSSWKWWKSGKTDLWNLKIEAIDMLHFLSSNIVLNKTDLSIDGDKILGLRDSDTDFKSEIFVNGDCNQGIERTSFYNALKKLIIEDDSYETINEFMKMACLQDNEISSIYVAKYALNEIRWRGGYALDQYVKFKGGYTDENGNKVAGIEDNVFLEQLVNLFKEDENLSLGDLRQLVFDKFEKLD